LIVQTNQPTSGKRIRDPGGPVLESGCYRFTVDL